MSIRRLYGGEKPFSDYSSDITSEVAERKVPPTYPFDIESGLDYIIGHFEPPIWPRTISTKTTQNKQILIYSREEAVARFNQASFLDCKINAYPRYTEWKAVNRQAPNFIFIDLDLGKFRSRAALDRALTKTLKNTCEKFNVAVNPSVLWSGNGYHIYLPVEAFVLEQESEFARFGNPSRKFIQFAEAYLSNNRSDPEHTKGLSFRNCMIRIPGSFNSKNGKREAVKIIQKWDGNKPSIKPLLLRFDLYLLVSKSKELHKKQNSNSNTKTTIFSFSTDWKSNK
jgi:hypothetical protein